MRNIPALPSPAPVPSECDRHRNAAVTALTSAQAVVAATFLTLCPLVQAQPVSTEPADGLSGSFGLGVASLPTYEGSANRRTLVAPELTLHYRSRDWGTVDFGQRGLVWTAVEEGRFRFALLAQLDPGRKDRDTSTLSPTPGDRRLAGMGRVKPSTEAGFGVGYGPLMVVARHALGEHSARGMQVDMSVEHGWALSDRLSLSLALGATWADRDTLQTDFGVTAAQAQATSFAVYTPKSGCRKVSANVGAEYAMASNWKLQANVGVSELGDVAAASPIVGRRSAASAALGVAHAF